MILVVSTCHDPLHEREFVSPVVRVIKNKQKDYRVVGITAVKETDLVQASAIIICGNALGDMEFIKHKDRLTIIKHSDVPVLGICAGMQLLCLLYGGKLYPCQEIGLVRLHLHDDGFDDLEQVYALHNISGTLPEDFSKHASSDKCIHVIRHKRKEQWGVLFHPEVRNVVALERFLDTSSIRSQG